MTSKLIINGVTPNKLYIGNSEIKKAYIGSNLVFQKQKQLSPLFTLYSNPTITEDGKMMGYVGSAHKSYQGIHLSEEGLKRFLSGTIVSVTYDYTERHASGREWIYGFYGYGYYSKTTNLPVLYSWDKVPQTLADSEKVVVNNREIDNNIKITTTVKWSTDKAEVLSDSGEIISTLDMSANPMPFTYSLSYPWGVGYLTDTILYGNIYLAESYIQFPDEDKKYYFYE